MFAAMLTLATILILTAMFAFDAMFILVDVVTILILGAILTSLH